MVGKLVKRRAAVGGLLLAVLLSPVYLAAQQPVTIADESDWNNLAQLRVWDEIVCKTKDGEWHRGKFVAFSEEALSLRVGKRDVGLRRGDVVRVSLLGRPKRMKPALIGAAIGFGIGAIIGSRNPEEDERATFAFLFGWMFAGIGAGTGAAVAPPSKTVIYRAKP